MSGALTPLEEDLLADLDVTALAGHARRLAELGATPTTGRDRDTAYIRATLRGWEVPLTLHRFETAISVPGPVRFRLARRTTSVKAITHPYSVSTPAEGLTTELRLAVPGDDLTGAIALVEGVPDPTSVARLAARGAVGLVYISPAEKLDPLPLAAPGGAPATVPVISIGRAAGEGFLALCAAGATPVHLQASVTWQPRRLIVPVAALSGVEEPDSTSFVLAGAESGSPASAAILLELCRLFSRHTGRLRRALRLAWWPAGAAPDVGGAWYAGHAWEELSQRAAAYVSLAGPAPPHFSAGPALRWFGEETLREGGIARPSWSGSLPTIDTTAFTTLGLPCLALPTGPAPDDPATGERDPAVVAALARDATIGALHLARLCTYPLLPLDLVALARAGERALDDLSAHAADPAALDPLLARAASCRARAEQLQLAALHVAQGTAPNYEEAVERTNRALRGFHWLLAPLLHHPGDRYIAAPPVEQLFPALAAALTPATDDASSHQRRLALVQERNRLLDACNAATTLADEALTALRALGID